MRNIESGSFEQYLEPPDKDKDEPEIESVWTRWNKPKWEQNGYERIAGEFRQYVVDREAYKGKRAQVFDQFLEHGVTPGDILAYKDVDVETNGELSDFEKEIKDKHSFQLVKDALDFLRKELIVSFEASQSPRNFPITEEQKSGGQNILLLGDKEFYAKMLEADGARKKRQAVVEELERRLLPEKYSPRRTEKENLEKNTEDRDGSRLGV